MKLLIETYNKNIDMFNKKIDGVILAVDRYSVGSNAYYSLEEIKNIVLENPTLEVFISMNKNIFNSEIEDVKEILIQLNKIKIKGIFFYDLAILELKRLLALDVDLIWNQTHMVTNYKTCNYYKKLGVNYALLSKEITLDEMLEIKSKSNIIPMVEVVSLPSVAFSRRKLISNYYKNLNKNGSKNIEVLEKVSNQKYELVEDNNGCCFFLKDILNGTCVIKNLFENDFPYIIMREYGIVDFFDLVSDTKNYISKSCIDDNYISKWKKLGDNTGFFFKKTIYKVKKNG